MISAVECSCTPATVYADGTKPSFYTEATRAEYMYRKLKGRVLYWGVHLNGLHLVGKP